MKGLNQIGSGRFFSAMFQFAVPLVVVYLAYKIGVSVATNDFKLPFLFAASAVALYVIKNKLLALYLLLFIVFLVPLNIEWFSLSSCHLPIRSATFAFLLIAIAFFSDKVIEGKRVLGRKKSGRAPVIFLFLFFVSTISSCVIPFIKVFLVKSGFINESLSGVYYAPFFPETILMLGSILLVFFVPEVIDSEEKLTKLCKFMLLLGCLTVIVGMLEHFLGWAYWHVRCSDRLEIPNAGIEVGTALIFPLCWAIQRYVRLGGGAYLACGILLVGTVLLSLTRSSIAGISLALLVIFALEGEWRNKIRGLLMMVAASCLILFWYSPQYLSDREVSRLTSPANLLGRILCYEAARDDFLRRNLLEKMFGSGYQTYGTYTISGDKVVYMSAHNEFLQIMMGSGLIGLIAIVGIAITTVVKCVRISRAARRLKAQEVLITSNAIIATTIGFSLMLQTSPTRLTLMYFVMLGLSLSLDSIIKDRIVPA